MKINIVIDIRTLSLKPSGIGLYVYYFIKEFVKYEFINLTLLTDVSESEEINELKDLGLEIIEYGKIAKKNLEIFSYFKFVNKALTDINPDFFWEPNQIIPIKFNGIQCKVVVTVHDILPLTHIRYHKWYYFPYFYFFLKKTFKNVDGIIYNSNDTKINVSNIFLINKNIKEHISYCIVNGTNCQNLCDDGYFLYIGNLEKKKGVDLLIDAFRIYLENGGGNKLFLAGNLREPDLLTKINNHNNDYPNTIEYFGYINKKYKEDLLSRCSCFVFPSRAEGFGIPPLEAMYYSKPIIASDLEIFKEIMDDTVNYFQLLNDKYDKYKLADCMLKYTKNVSYDQILLKYSSKSRGKELVEYFQLFKDN